MNLDDLPPSVTLAARRAVERCGSPGEAAVFSAVAGAFLLQTGPELWLSEWNPMVIALPLLLFFICCAGIGAGCRSVLLPGVIAGSFAAQTHLGTVPSVLITGLAAVSAGMIRGRPKPSGNGRSGRPAALLAALAILWTAPLLEEALARGQGNISRIIASWRKPGLSTASARSTETGAGLSPDSCWTPPEASCTGWAYWMPQWLLFLRCRSSCSPWPSRV
jgi:hypothetical protein